MKSDLHRYRHFSGQTARLRGEVKSRAERAAAQGAVRSAPGVTQGVNELRLA